MLRSTRPMACRFPAIQGIQTGNTQSKGSNSLEVDKVAAGGCSQINIDEGCKNFCFLNKFTFTPNPTSHIYYILLRPNKMEGDLSSSTFMKTHFGKAPFMTRGPIFTSTWFWIINVPVHGYCCAFFGSLQVWFQDCFGWHVYDYNWVDNGNSWHHSHHHG